MLRFAFSVNALRNAIGWEPDYQLLNLKGRKPLLRLQEGKLIAKHFRPISDESKQYNTQIAPVSILTNINSLSLSWV